MIKKQIISAGLFLLAAILSFSVVYAPFFGLAFFLIAGILFAVSVIFVYSPWISVAEAAAVLIIFKLVSGYFSVALFFCILFVPVGVSVGMAFRKKLGFNQTMQITILVSIVMLGLTAVVFIAEFSNPFSAKTAFAPYTEALRAVLSDIYNAQTNSLLTTGSTTSYADTIYNFIVYNIPAFFSILMLFSAVVCYWSVKAIFKRTTESVAFMGRFDGCRVSVAGAIFYFLTMLVSFFSSGTLFYVALTNFSTILTCIFAYAGFSLLAFLLDLKEFTPFLKGVIMIAAVGASIFLSLYGFVALVGTFDSYYNIRERLQNKGV